MTDVLSARAAALDAADPLAAFRDRFLLDEDVVAYLDGNSLGRLPRATLDRVTAFLREEWGGRLIRGWTEGWVDLPTAVGDEVGAVLGAAPGQVVVADSTSVLIHKALHAAIGLRPDRDEVVVSACDFPTDRYLVESAAQQRGLTVRTLRPDLVENVTADALAGVLGERTAVVVLSHVDYRSGTLLDLPALTAQAHAAGAVVLWDLCHSAGVVPVDLDAHDVDLAVGCTYKYLNGGPGSPAFVYVARRHLAAVQQPIPGWWSAADLFAMAEEYRAAPDVRRMLSGTPDVAGLLAVREGAALVAEAGVPAVRRKSEQLTALAVDALVAAGIEVVTPQDPARRGSHVTARVHDARAVTERLVRRGVVPDFREPDLVRLGLSPLSTTFAEAARGLEALVDVAG